MANPFLLKLRHGACLTAEDEALLMELSGPVRSVPARSDLVQEGAEAGFLPLILEGWACRYRDLENGKRQITTLFVPGDLCEPFGALPHSIDHAIAAITPVVFAPVSLKAIGAAARSSHRIYEALWWDLLCASAIERESIVSLGRRSAAERMGHLFCELYVRLGLIGLINRDQSCSFPLRQADLGDVLGLSTVHVNRSLQELREAGWISLRNQRLTIHDLAALRDFSLFDPSYLHMDHSASVDRNRPPFRTVNFQ